MEYAASTDRSAATGKQDCGRGHGYLLARTVRVRREAFGLLFYDTASTNLTFVKCGDLFEVVKGSGVTQLWANDRDDSRTLRVLNTLMNRGLIHGVPSDLQ
jgi:putative mycofactocin binding protein MftB